MMQSLNGVQFAGVQPKSRWRKLAMALPLIAAATGLSACREDRPAPPPQGEVTMPWQEMGEGQSCMKFRMHGDEFVLCDGVEATAVVQAPRSSNFGPNRIQPLSSWQEIGEGTRCLKFRLDHTNYLLCDGVESSGLARFSPGNPLGTGHIGFRSNWEAFGNGATCRKLEVDGDQFMYCDGVSSGGLTRIDPELNTPPETR